ncbi:hypothetical protein VP01_1104g4 [Puccinia sorghi]|uniref:Major facilitator superfamily (MFS) profile domain-containing protein n=1 Tax=Puccinia sorghi TaxID=27349 RepID=A0A0L6VU80_9BASI|nr:hypothetical protein VP01_1104g4 [Puccinia sorghi]
MPPSQVISSNQIRFTTSSVNPRRNSQITRSRTQRVISTKLGKTHTSIGLSFAQASNERLERKALWKLDLTLSHSIPLVSIFWIDQILVSYAASKPEIREMRGLRVNKNQASSKDYGLILFGNVRYLDGSYRTAKLPPFVRQTVLDCLDGHLHMAEIPANLLLKKLGPNYFLPTIVTCWGLITTFQGFVKSYAGLIAARLGLNAKKTLGCRFFLGLVEGQRNVSCEWNRIISFVFLYQQHFIVDMLNLISRHVRRELQLRIAFFFSSASLAGGFSGLLAYGIIRLDGMGGLAGWSWILIVGFLLILRGQPSNRRHFHVRVGTDLLFHLPGYDRGKQISVPGRKGVGHHFSLSYICLMMRVLTIIALSMLKARLARDLPMADEAFEHFSFAEVLAALKSPHVLINSASLFMSGAMIYSLAYFQPTIRILSISQSIDECPAICRRFYWQVLYSKFHGSLIGAVISIFLWVIFRLVTIGCALVGMIGFILFYVADPLQTSLKYGSLFLSISGAYSTMPPLSAWLSNNSEGHYRRASSIAIGFVSSNLGGILSTWAWFCFYFIFCYVHLTDCLILWSIAFPSKGKAAVSHWNARGPYLVSVLLSAGIVITVTSNLIWLKMANRWKVVKREQLLKDYPNHDPLSHHENLSVRKQAWADLGDRHPDFRYAY